MIPDTIPGAQRIERIGRATLILGDCRDVLPHLPRVDAVVTDPPYGIGASAGVGKYGRIKVDGDLGWDDCAPDLTFVLALELPSIIWGGNYFVLPPSRRYLVWDKGAGFRGRDFAECEQAWCSFDGNARVLNRDPLASRDYRAKIHPTQKPVEVMRWSLSQLPPNCEAILDPFMGSGTTGVACVLDGKAFIGIEREPKYFEAACRRMREATGDDAGPLFGEMAA